MSSKILLLMALCIGMTLYFRYNSVPKEAHVPEKHYEEKREFHYQNDADEGVRTTDKVTSKLAKNIPPVDASAPPKEITPGEELREIWYDELRSFLVQIDAENGENTFNNYMDLKKSYEADIASIAKKLDQTYRWDESKLDFKLIDQKENLRLSKIYGEKSQIHAEQVKQLFGGNYSKVSELLKEFNQRLEGENQENSTFFVDQSIEH